MRKLIIMIAVCIIAAASADAQNMITIGDEAVIAPKISCKEATLWNGLFSGVDIRWAVFMEQVIIVTSYSGWEYISEITCVPKGSAFKIVFTDGSEISFANTKDSEPFYFGGWPYLKRCTVTCSYVPTQEDMSMLQQKTIASFRLYHSGGCMEKNVDTDDAVILRQMFNLYDYNMRRMIIEDMEMYDLIFEE